MAISCFGCGRQYDDALFLFGRTVNCACGARVGSAGGGAAQCELNTSPGSTEIKFFANVNVARLVCYLRALGIDTIWEDAINDGELVRRAIEEKRFVLTLDKRLIKEWRADNVFLLSSDKAFEEFREIILRFKLKPLAPKLFTRCLVCNAPLRLGDGAGNFKRRAPSGEKKRTGFFLLPGVRESLLGRLAHETDAGCHCGCFPVIGLI